MAEKEVSSVLQKYKKKLDKELGQEFTIPNKPIVSREYLQFKKEYMPGHLNWYEKACNYCEKVFKIAPDKKKAAELQRYIDVAHLDITPTGAVSFAYLVPLAIAFFGSLIGYMIPAFFGQPTLFFVFFSIIVGLVLIAPFSKMPEFLANSWRMKASNQMVLSIFYVVTYMRHTSNIENAIDFAAEHLAPPLALDFKKILWDVETERFESVNESLDYYLETWREWNVEFIEAMHLVEGSLYESSEDRRLGSLDKALSVILDETYEKMLHYAHNLKSPITMLHMMGVILPILGLVILPLVVSFLGNVKWYHIATLYDVVLPIMVFYMGKVILSKRPSGYGDSDVSELNPELKKYKKIIVNFGKQEVLINPINICVLVWLVLFLIGLSPVIMHGMNPRFDVPLGGGFNLLGYRCPQHNPECDITQQIGPFGIGASILSLFIPLSFGISIGLYFKLKSKNIIKIREKTKKLEDEFASGLFQLGNRLGDGLPVEIAFGKVADIMEGTISGSFFSLVSTNIRKLGMGVKQAIYDKKIGALIYFPSSVIESSMKVLIESAKKGPRVASQALINVARYIKEIHKVNERLKDLMGDIIGSMKAQVSFLSPVISGIVIGITSMITTILGNLSQQLSNITAEAGEAAAGVGGAGILGLFGDGIPTYFFQIIVGIYVVELSYILTILANGIENGEDKLSQEYALGVNMRKSVLLYAVVSVVVMLIFNLIAGQIMTSIAVG
ncbi:hypothetical protein D6745_02805 [Candidatus Woesearchaeota archaeon]|nr:MAG: hypothetical protein D6745_02805 [Candidatus Woesearchaeota archaeon]